MSYFTALVSVLLLLLAVLPPTSTLANVRFPRTNRTLNNNFITKRNVFHNNNNVVNNLNNANRNAYSSSSTSSSSSTTTSTTQKSREQYLVQVFEVLIMTLDQKLQRIEQFDQAIQRIGQKVDYLSNRLAQNTEKTDSILKLCESGRSTKTHFDAKLASIDSKIGHIEDKLTTIQGNGNSIPGSSADPKPRNHYNNNDTQALNQINTITMNIDRKLNSNMNFVARHLGQIISMVYDVHNAVIVSDPEVKINPNRSWSTTSTTTTTQTPSTNQRQSRLSALEKQMKPIIDVSEKMDEVWNVVMGTKSSVDHLVPKSDELLTHTQRQERAIGEIHNDLRLNANKIIANLNIFEKRLNKQEKDVAALARRPATPDFLLDPTIDRLVEYSMAANTDPVVEDTIPTTTTKNNLPPAGSSMAATNNQFYTYNVSVNSNGNGNAANFITPSRIEKRKGGIIFPSVKNKPTVVINTNFSMESPTTFKDVKGYSCADLLNLDLRISGIYYLQIRGTAYWYLKVYCEQEIGDGGWTVIQRRDDFNEVPRESFNRDWTDYKNGFGDPTKEFWLGNENIYMLTNNDEYMLRVELEDFEGNKRYAQYSSFRLHSENENYRLEIDGYEGTAGDSLNDPWYGSHSSPFSTYNRDNDRSSLNCASMLKGGWWWKSCGRGLNGLYLTDPQDLTARQGIVWFRWRGWDYSLKRSLMMIKPKSAITL